MKLLDLKSALLMALHASALLDPIDVPLQRLITQELFFLHIVFYDRTHIKALVKNVLKIWNVRFIHIQLL